MLTRRQLPFPRGLYPAAVRRARASVVDTLLSRLTGRLSQSAALAHDLASGIEELVVVPKEVAVHRVDDGGPFVFLDVGNRTVLLAGDWLHDVKTGDGQPLEPKAWWPRCVVVLRAPTTGQVLKFDVLDSKPLPIRLISPVLSDFRESCVVQGALAELGDRLVVREADARY